MKGANKDPSAWYPGKHLRRFSTSSSDKAAAAAVQGGGDPSSPNAQRAAVSGAAVSTAVESSRNPVERHDPAGVSFDDACVIDGTVSGGERSATVTLSLLDLRFPRTQTPRVQVIAEGRVLRPPRPLQPRQDGAGFKPESLTFQVEDAFADIYVHLLDDVSGEIQGIIVIPLRRYVGITGPTSSKDEWMQFFPFSEACPGARDDSSSLSADWDAASAPTSSASATVGRRRSIITPTLMNSTVLLKSGDKNLPGSAMTKPTSSVGFLGVRVSVEPKMEPWKLMFRPPYSNLLEDIRARGASADVAGSPDRATLLLPFDPEAFFMLLRRLERLAGLPSVISPMLNFPEVFVVIILYGFLCFATELWHLPIIGCFILFLNGSLSALDERHGHVLIWNRSETAARRSIRIDDFAKFKSLQPFFAVYQSKLNSFVTYAEKFMNLWNWSESRVSFIVYGASFAVAVSLSILIATVGPRFLLFVFGSCVLIVASGGASILMQLLAEGGAKASKDSLSSTALEGHEPTVLWCSHGFKKLNYFLNRVPDATILDHSFIASSSLVFENGQEMQDAAETMAAAATAAASFKS